MPNRTNIIVLIPAYQPTPALPHLVQQLTAGGIEHIVIVDDGSRPDCDSIFTAAETAGGDIVRHAVNGGKGKALKTGLQYILDRWPDCVGVVTADADGQHLASDILGVCDKLQQTNSVVFGCRDFSKKEVPPRSRIGNRITSLAVQLFWGLSVPDTQTGLRALPNACLADMLKVTGDRYEYEMNMMLALHQQQYPILIHPIETVYLNQNASSHFHPFRDSAQIYRVFLKFIGSSLLSFLVDIALFQLLIFLLAAPLQNLYILAATAIARVFSSVFNFTINRKSVFKSQKRPLLAFFRYIITCLIIMLSSAGIVSILTMLLHWPETLIKIIVDLPLFLLSFTLQKNWVFPS